MSAEITHTLSELRFNPDFKEHAEVIRQIQSETDCENQLQKISAFLNSCSDVEKGNRSISSLKSAYEKMKLFHEHEKMKQCLEHIA